ncbi:hypothetical protein T310_6192 [Rasamsonia emersonii CBS 393.64]|uniref:Flavoprotein oxygenase n=1 Tax=Rasamsonia emersonii (strain ATCC 16479 / CBS 393.64 / IMI 116815) TaxID=1408163 RepID=A0A0F4YQD1_RASE3|nr:hypothetical protein T310_6192 [Rasamsonia emersonii CBS 393.64]KKA19823.1 hypothetical protein T310_6192 [Rasamsonia emersonii CBS 393.64]
MEELSHSQHQLSDTQATTELLDGTDTERELSSPSAFATAEIPPDVLDTADQRRTSAQDFGYSSSSSSNIFDDVLDADGLDHLRSTTSSRSSISSIPGKETTIPKTGGSMRHATKIRGGPFRKPSSVRAMQMHTEDEDEDFVSPSRLRGGGGGGRPGYYYSANNNGTPKKQAVKKEYPLVLLHCNLLPPTLSLPPGIGIPSRKILEEVLPPRYLKRWRLLEEKLGSGVLRDRGVLISHPQEMYDLLEERLLESLELQRPRLQNGHFLGRDEPDSGKEDGDDGYDNGSDDEEGEECPDCGCRVIRNEDTSRKWEIKVYAANGLMKAGAWAAAWREMEKVDVEVGLWLPSSVRSELEKRILEEEAITLDGDLKAAKAGKGSLDEDRPQPSQEQIDGLDDALPSEQRNFAASNAEARPEFGSSGSFAYERKTANDIELQTLLINYIRVLASDKRNVAIALLSVLVLFLAMAGGARPSPSLTSLPPEIAEVIETPAAVTATQYCSASTSSSYSLGQAATATPVVHVPEARAEPAIVDVRAKDADRKQTPLARVSSVAVEPGPEEQVVPDATVEAS